MAKLNLTGKIYKQVKIMYDESEAIQQIDSTAY